MTKKEQPTANRNYKDTVFRMLFSDRKSFCMNISLPIVQICRCEIYSIFPANIRN